MNAREKFKQGDRVRLTDKAIEYGICRRDQKTPGIVHGFGRRDFSVWVAREGVKTAHSYHMDFWEEITEKV